MAQDDLDHIPSIVPTRDSDPQHSGSRTRTSGAGERSHRSGSRKPSNNAGSAGLLARCFIAISLAAAVGACVWAWQLQARLQRADEQLANYSSRIGDLEARLSDTDEGMSQSASVQAVKIAKLDGEVRKLWDNVWKETKDRLGKLETASASQGKSVKSLEASMTTSQAQLKAASADVAQLKSVAGDLARLMSSAKANQAEVERIADDLNRINLSLAKLDKRVTGNEEWVASVNAFRRQVNTSLSELQSTVRAMQVPRSQ